MDVEKKRKEKKEKEKEKIIIEKEMCVCLYVCFYVWLLNQKDKKNEFNILIYMHKYLKDI